MDECDDDGDCAASMGCSEGVCVGKCYDDSNCGDNFKCAVSGMFLYLVK